MTNSFPDSKTFWHAKRVMATGGNGFLGKNIVRKLNERGADVCVVDTHLPAEFTLSRVEGLRVDLRRLEDIRRALSDSKPQIVIHLAGRVGGIGANANGWASRFWLHVFG